MVARADRAYKSNMHIAIIGARGHLGSRAIAALRRIPGVTLTTLSRSPRSAGAQPLDLTRPETFGALPRADIVINASSSHSAAPDRLAEYCLANGITLLEASSDRVVVQRLLDQPRPASSRGALVLGAGIFTGLSNLLGAAAVSGMAECERLDLAVRSSPFSGAGSGTVALMVDALRTPTCSIVAGARVESRAVSRGTRWQLDGASLDSLHVPLAEPVMLHHSTGVPNISMYMLPKPAWMTASFLAMPPWLLASGVYRMLLWLQFTLLRRWLLRERATRVELFAVAHERRTGRKRELQLTAADGMWTAGVAIAAMASLLAKEKPAGGVYCIDQLLTLEQVLAQMRRIDAACIDGV